VIPVDPGAGDETQRFPPHTEDAANTEQWRSFADAQDRHREAAHRLAYPEFQGYPPLRAEPDGLAIASLVLSLLWLGGAGSILAVAFGHSSRSAARRRGQQPSAMATVGMVAGYTGLLLLVLIIAVSVPR
jgi:hypothetical protein